MRKRKPSRTVVLQWIIIICIAEVVIISGMITAWKLLMFAAIAFWIGSALRFLRVYPGTYEPPIVDFLSGLLCFLSAGITGIIRNEVALLAAEVIAGPLTITPHFIYIMKIKKRRTAGFYLDKLPQ